MSNGSNASSSTTGGEVTTQGENTSSTDPGSTSTSSTTTDPGSTSSTTTDPGSTSTSSTTTNPGTTTVDPSETTGGSGYGQCGWNPNLKFYACASDGGSPSKVDPNGVHPIDCPDPLPAVGSMCNEMSPVNGIGCCMPNGDNYFCAGDSMVAVLHCGA